MTSAVQRCSPWPPPNGKNAHVGENKRHLQRPTDVNWESWMNLKKKELSLSVLVLKFSVFFCFLFFVKTILFVFAS